MDDDADADADDKALRTYLKGNECKRDLFFTIKFARKSRFSGCNWVMLYTNL